MSHSWNKLHFYKKSNVANWFFYICNVCVPKTCGNIMLRAHVNNLEQQHTPEEEYGLIPSLVSKLMNIFTLWSLCVSQLTQASLLQKIKCCKCFFDRCKGWDGTVASKIMKFRHSKSSFYVKKCPNHSRGCLINK